MTVAGRCSVACAARWLTWPEEAPGSPGQQHLQRLGQEHPPPCSGIPPQHCASLPACYLPADTFSTVCIPWNTRETPHECAFFPTAVELCKMTFLVSCQPQQAKHEDMSGARAAAAMGSAPVPDGVILDGHHAWGQQLELLLDLEPVAPAGHLDAPVEHGRIRLTLQRPAWLQLCHQHHIHWQASQPDCHHDYTRLCS